MMILLRKSILSKFILDIIKNLIWLINGLENGSSGTIYIPTIDELDLSESDIVVEGIIEKEFEQIYRDKNTRKFRIVSIDDNRKGNLQHYKLGVCD
jgi:hypothetical protein